MYIPYTSIMTSFTFFEKLESAFGPAVPNTPSEGSFDSWAASMPEDELRAELVSSMKAIVHAAYPKWSAELKGKGMRFSRDIMLSGNDQNKRNECIQWLKTCASRVGWASMSPEEKDRLQAEGQAAYDAASFDFPSPAVNTSTVCRWCLWCTVAVD
jgi:hypothetical protein